MRPHNVGAGTAWWRVVFFVEVVVSVVELVGDGGVGSGLRGGWCWYSCWAMVVVRCVASGVVVVVLVLGGGGCRVGGWWWFSW